MRERDATMTSDPGVQWLARHGRHGGVGFGAQLATMADGAARGSRILDLLAGPELSVRIAVDRGFEIAEIATRGVSIGWASPAHLRSPMLHEHAEDDQMGFLRSFSGALATCGLVHFGRPDRRSATPFGYPIRREAVLPMHGRAAFLPATLDGYGVADGKGGRIVWAQGTMVQALVFGEHLALTRRIELPLFGNSMRLFDTVENRGSRPCPHAMLYHWNFGWPLLEEGTRIDLPEGEVLWCSDETRRTANAYRIAAGPTDGYGELVFEHRVDAGDDARAQVTLSNTKRGLAATLEYAPAALPALYQWQAFEPGIYALGIEPATRRFDEANIFLEPGGARHYTQTLTLT